MIIRFHEEQANMRIRFHVPGMFAQLADMDVEGGKVIFMRHSDHRLVRFPLMDGSQHGKARFLEEVGKGFF
jgi:hypothetical protein